MLRGLNNSGVEGRARRELLWVRFALIALVTGCALTSGAAPSAKARGGIGMGNQIPPEFNPNPEKEFNDDDLKGG